MSVNPMETVTTDTSQKGVEGLRCVLFPGILPVRDLVFEFIKHVLVHDQDAAHVPPVGEIHADVVLLNATPSAPEQGDRSPHEGE